MGAALGLGLDRAVLGDIAVGEPSYMVCTADIAGFVCDELKQAGRVGLTVTRVPLSDLPQVTHALTERDETVASLRLDAIVAAMFDLSRGHAAEAIEQGKVQLCHKLCEDTARAVSAGDVVSVRGLGRGKLLEVGGRSKKGRIWVRLGVWG
ncbi:hypothetical protein FACS1894217_07420 [Clostridia bacterium]|nr:hypothetical protein FACS1894217_07420 [Clostridia bacterium]